MTSMQVPGAILRAILASYGSLDEPRFDFVKRLVDEGRWEPLATRIRQACDAVETTDLNSDVCRTFELRERDLPCATLQLSLVGPYGVLYAHDSSREDVFVTAKTPALLRTERVILEECSKAGVEMLELSVLRLRVPLRLFDTEPDRVRVYQALFSDVDYLPGEYAAAR